MDNLILAGTGALRVLLAGLLLGAGLPAVFALGIRAQAWAAGGDAELDHERPHPIGKVLAWLCYGVVIAGVATGLLVIVASGLGYDVEFTPLPTIVQE